MAWTRLSFSAIGWCSLRRVRAASRKSYRCGCLDPAASRAAPKSNCSNTFRSKFEKKWNGLLKQKDLRKAGWLKKTHMLRCARPISRQRTRKVRLRSSIFARLASEVFLSSLLLNFSTEIEDWGEG